MTLDTAPTDSPEAAPRRRFVAVMRATAPLVRLLGDLELGGLAVQPCQSAEELLQLVREWVVEAVVVDATQHSADVVDLAGLLTGASPELPVVVLTEYADGALQRQLMGRGPVWLLAVERDWAGVGRALEALLERSARALAADRHARQILSWSRATRRDLDELIHELRTPVAVVQGFCSNLLDGLDGPLAPEQRRSLTRIQAATELLVETVNKVRQRLPGRAEEGPEPDAEARAGGRRQLRLADLCDEALSLVEGAAAEAGVELALVAPRDLPPLWGDRVRLTQLAVNLLSNAIRHTPRGGRVEIELARDRLSTTHGERSACRLTVRDTGSGIEAADLEQIFNAGFTRGVGRAGLGLAICRDVANEHCGALSVDSLPGHGASFNALLPLDPRQRPVSIRLVEDSAQAEELVLALLRAAGTPRPLVPGEDVAALAGRVLEGGAAVVISCPTESALNRVVTGMFTSV